MCILIALKVSYMKQYLRSQIDYHCWAVIYVKSLTFLNQFDNYVVLTLN